MLESLKQIGKEVGKELSHAWENLSEGWRELLTRGGDALTHFRRDKAKDMPTGYSARAFPSWSLLAGEVMETGREIVVRLEAPGLEKEDCEIVVDGNTLYIRGEKRYQRESDDGRYYVMECAYGSFERALPLPKSVDGDRAEANYRHGILTVTLPKTGATGTKHISVK